MKKAYSVIELIVVIGVITAIFSISLPSFTSINDNYALSIATNHITDYLTRARVMSMAASEAGLGKNQFYQVKMTGFVNTNQTFPLAVGTSTADWIVELGSGSGQCGIDSDATIVTPIDTYKMPNKIFVKEYFPFPSGSVSGANSAFSAVVRFSQGKMGFNCGSDDSPSLDSTALTNNISWQPAPPSTPANEAFIKTMNSRTNKAKYIYIDRFSGQSSVSDSSKYNVVATTDTDAPIWKWDIDSTAYPSTAETLTASCNTQTNKLDLSFGFNKAKDKVSGAINESSTVYYGIKYQIGTGSEITLENSYNGTGYNTTINVASCPADGTTVKVLITAFDSSGNAQSTESNPEIPTIAAGVKTISAEVTTP